MRKLHWTSLGRMVAVACVLSSALLVLGGVQSESIGQLAGLASAQTPPTVAPGRLLFTRDGGLWSLRPSDGQPPVQVVPRPTTGLIISGRWAPDGSRVAYIQYEVVPGRNAPVSSLFIAGADGSDRRAIIVGDEPGTQLQEPTWSADGRYIYYFHRRPSVAERIQRVERVDVSTGERTTAFEGIGQFDVSADGRWMAITEVSGVRMGLTLVDLRTGQASPLVSLGVFEDISAPRFDPTSQRLLFSGLHYGTEVPSQPSPGTSVPLSSQRDVLGSLLNPPLARAHGLPKDLYVMPIPSGQPRRLTSMMLDDPVGAWAPDGSQLALLSGEFLALTPASEGTPVPILTPGAYGSVDWTR